MEIYYDHNVTQLDGLYEPFDDAPGLSLTIHLHGWAFPEQTGAGEAKLRVEIREGTIEEDEPMLGWAFVTATAKEIISCQGVSPLSQAIMDGLLSHEAVRDFFAQTAEKALDLPEPEKPLRPARKIPEIAFYNPRLHQ
ncbi:MAG: hypothetical protein HQL53_12680 [Magnetococcales bacterium]|nr:hypothetical protein [Magnetococcales bacterium]